MTLRVLIVLVLVASGAGRALAAESGWSATFGPAAVATRLPAGAVSIVVVAMGGAPEAGEAARALLAAIRAGGRASQALDGASLGDLGAADDAAVVARSATLAVTYVAIVRWIDPGRGETPRALVQIYDQRGALVVGFTARPGVPLARPLQPDVPEPARAPSRPPRPVIPRARALELYEDRRVGYGQVFVNGISQAGKHFYTGRFRRKLGERELYVVLGREDLASRYDTRGTARWLLMLSGVAVGVGGLGYALLAYDDHGCQQNPDSDYCAPGYAREHILWGMGVIALGTGAFIYGHTMDRHPVSLSGRYELAADHNRKLERDLGLEPELAGRPEPTWHVAPVVLRSGGGLSLSLTF